MSLPTIPRPVLYAAAGLAALLLVALIVGLLRPAPPGAPTAPPSIAAPAPTIPQAYPSTPALPTAPPPASASAPPTASAVPAWPALYPLDTPTERGAVETVELAPDAWNPRYSTLTRRTVAGATAAIDGVAARQAADLADRDGIRVTRTGLIRVEADSEYTITLALDAPGRLWTSRGECTAALDGVPILRLSGAQDLAPNSGVLEAGYHEVSMSCANVTGKWTALVALRHAEAERPTVAPLFLRRDDTPKPAEAEAASLPPTDAPYTP